ncbi:MAG: hypothetical protein EA386_06240 [Rhodobacteraceae bacterium]|nr:MAG: hypothetical protein EA386_06240 [Paracoccaceae bacterium]
MMLRLTPKAHAIIAVMFARFMPPDRPDPALGLRITTILARNTRMTFTVWALAGDILLRRVRAPRSARVINRGCALPLAAVASWMLAHGAW